MWLLSAVGQVSGDTKQIKGTVCGKMKLLRSSTRDTGALHKYRECVLKRFVPVQFKYHIITLAALCKFKDIWDESYLYDLHHKTTGK